jgi:hypothetical protein
MGRRGGNDETGSIDEMVVDLLCDYAVNTGMYWGIKWGNGDEHPC